jgi:hypothetical protein
LEAAGLAWLLRHHRLIIKEHRIEERANTVSSKAILRGPYDGVHRQAFSIPVSAYLKTRIALLGNDHYRRIA